MHIVSRSAAKLSYNDAQDVIDGKTLGDVAVDPAHNAESIAHDIKVLHDIAKQLRDLRFQNGSIRSHSLRLKFTLDENGLPTDCGQQDRGQAQNLIEEVSGSL